MENMQQFPQNWEELVKTLEAAEKQLSMQLAMIRAQLDRARELKGE